MKSYLGVLVVLSLVVIAVPVVPPFIVCSGTGIGTCMFYLYICKHRAQGIGVSECDKIV